MPALRKKTAAAAAHAIDVTAAEDTYTPLTTLHSAIRFWRVIFLLMVAGGLVGILIHSFRPPLHEAVARFPASIDFIATGPISERDEDIALNSIGDLVGSEWVMRKVVDEAAAGGLQTSVKELKQSMLLERRVNVWVLRVRSTDPQRAEQLASVWANLAYKELLNAYQNALEAARLSDTMRAFESCLERAVVSETSGAQCSPARFSEIQADLRDAGAAYTKAKIATAGISPTLVLGPLEPAALSPRPLTPGRSQVALAGSMLGLLAGIWLVQSGLAERWLKRN